MDRIECALIVIYVCSVIACYAMVSCFYSANQGGEIVFAYDSYLGYISAYLFILTWDAAFKIFTFWMLFRCIILLYKAKKLLRTEKTSYDMSEDIIWQTIIAAIITCTDVILTLAYLIT